MDHGAIGCQRPCIYFVAKTLNKVLLDGENEKGRRDGGPVRTMHYVVHGKPRTLVCHIEDRGLAHRWCLMVILRMAGTPPVEISFK